MLIEVSSPEELYLIRDLSCAQLLFLKQFADKDQLSEEELSDEIPSTDFSLKGALTKLLRTGFLNRHGESYTLSKLGRTALEAGGKINFEVTNVQAVVPITATKASISSADLWLKDLITGHRGGPRPLLFKGNTPALAGTAEGKVVAIYSFQLQALQNIVDQ